MDETWKAIILKDVTFPYEISNIGNVKSLEKRVNCRAYKKRILPEKIIKNRLDGKGYPFVSLYSEGIEPLQIRVHQLVAISFIPNPENKPCVNHINGIRTDNRVENLEWCTYSENTINGIQRGTIKGITPKINREIAEQIRMLYSDKKYNQYELADMFGIGQVQISRIVLNKNWTDIPEWRKIHIQIVKR